MTTKNKLDNKAVHVELSKESKELQSSKKGSDEETKDTPNNNKSVNNKDNNEKNDENEKNNENEKNEQDQKKTEDIDPEEIIKKKDKEIEDSNDRFLRLSAEFENYKKRSRREMNDFRRFAYENVIKELLPVVDNLERALATPGDDEVCKGIAEGVNLTLKETFKVFNKFGVTPIEAIHKPFDPLYHQAVGQQESDEYPENTIFHEIQKGYMIHDRLLRPTMAIVSKKPPKEDCNKKEENINKEENIKE